VFTVTSPGSAADLAATLDAMGALYAPGAAGQDWGVAPMVWDRTLDGTRQALPPVGAADLVTIANLVDEWTPDAGRTWVTGQLRSHVFTVADGRMVSTITLRQGVVPNGRNSSPVTWDDIPPAVAWVDLAPADRWFEYSLATVF
jgi:hypothetical protein